MMSLDVHQLTPIMTLNALKGRCGSYPAAKLHQHVSTTGDNPAAGPGPRLRENIISLARQVFPAGKEISVGQKLSIEFKGGASRVMVVTAVSEVDVTLDGNHPLAGLDLTFAIKLERVE